MSGVGCGGNSLTGGDQAQFLLELHGPVTYQDTATGTLHFSLGVRVEVLHGGAWYSEGCTLQNDWRFVFTKGGAPSWELNQSNLQAVLGSQFSYFFAEPMNWPSAAHVDVTADGLPADFRVTHPCDGVQVTVHVRDPHGDLHELSITGGARFY
jgi:hypothetical protein